MVCDNSTIYFAPADFIKSRGTYAKDGIVVHFIDDVFYAHSSRCPHMPEVGNLEYGVLSGESKTISCPKHFFEYCIVSGKNKNELKREKYGDLLVFTVLVEDDSLYIKFPEK